MSDGNGVTGVGGGGEDGTSVAAVSGGGAQAAVPLGVAQAAAAREEVAPTPRVPTSEAEADAMLAERLGDDPAAMRAAAREFAEKMEQMAARAEQKSGRRAAAATALQEIKTADAADASVGASSPPATATSIPTAAAQAPAPPRPPQQPPPPQPPQPSRAAQSVPQRSAPAQGPTGYMAMPEGLYVWTPQSWGGRPLHAVPDRVVEKKDRPTLMIMVLVAPCYARDRAGRVVSLPEGARVVVFAGVAWAPVIPLAKGATGRPVLWAAPVVVPETGQPLTYETGDGGREWALDVRYDPDPRDPSRPRLIDIETVKGAT
jgi:hypothetical protein